MELFTAAINGAAAWLNPSSVQTQEAPQDVEPEADQEGFDISELGMLLDTMQYEVTAAEFEEAAEMLRNSGSKLTQDQQLQLYGLYKQGIMGDVNIPKPSMLDMAGSAKWNAWKALEGYPPASARRAYTYLVNNLGRYQQQDGDMSVGNSNSSMCAPISTLVASDNSIENSTWSNDQQIFQLVVDDNIELVKKMLDNDSGIVNKIDDKGMTLLHFAVDRGHVDMTKLLLQAGADRSIADKDGMTPLDYATICEYDTLVALLSE